MKPYDVVRIVSDRFIEAGVPPGSIGVVVDQHPGGAVEVEVSRPDGATIAVFSARQDELEPVDPRSLGPRPELPEADQAIFDTLHASHLDFRDPHRVEHHLYFPTHPAAKRAVQELRAAKYKLRQGPSAEGDEWLVRASHTTLLDEQLIAGTISAMRRLAASFNGRYDGWQVQDIK
ncbi:MAG: DUF4926 domain-containing protein [Methanobacteriota archaeon]|nr:MAG: DUF4926 domain-containing protein [Euryarchaeota archaeon]